MKHKVAYIMSRFPKVTETFILYEMVELQNLGLDVEVFPIIREQESVAHPEAQSFVERSHFYKPFSASVIATQFYWLANRPLRFLSTWTKSIVGNLGSLNFLIRAVAIVPIAMQFARNMKQLGVQHVHAHYATHPALAAYVIRRMTGFSYSITVHAHDIYVDRTMLREKVQDAAFIVAISDYNRKLLQDLYGKDSGDKIKVIHCGIDPAVFQPRQKTPAQEFKIINVASLEEYKGQTYLIDACGELKARGLQFQCLLVGDGEDRPKLEAQIRRSGLDREVVLLGRQPRERVSHLLAEADALVLPSIVTESGKMEGLPVALMEALATEIPVVATSISGIPELIEHERTGLLVPEKDARALADALMRLHSDRSLGKRFGVNGREKVLREFNLKTNTKELYSLFVKT